MMAQATNPRTKVAEDTTKAARFLRFIRPARLRNPLDVSLLATCFSPGFLERRKRRGQSLVGEFTIKLEPLVARCGGGQ